MPEPPDATALVSAMMARTTLDPTRTGAISNAVGAEVPHRLVDRLETGILPMMVDPRRRGELRWTLSLRLCALRRGKVRISTILLPATRQMIMEMSTALTALISVQRRSSRCSRNGLTGPPPSSSETSSGGGNGSSADERMESRFSSRSLGGR